jgi:hypothetical protein
MRYNREAICFWGIRKFLMSCRDFNMSDRRCIRKSGIEMTFEGVKVFIVEDSDFYRSFLEKILQDRR